ncbi:hypothetical protein CDSM653_02398 [Caldanaerobacter subterraneus subsp. pacificus DSM 12653]|uniref:Uncharacterized protein n=1 Tax=Caldanaerobacter subterraneus subsp. pacificus DSM 12653 TaxID=391606 RepID=A0A0F5PJR3_9THEO|nr:hypothetical protein CDSM653_02398 [Caldanaerobacter subterraneus subsp. pacificus DSM 12653]
MREKFLAYLRGIETQRDKSTSSSPFQVFSLPKRD